MPNGPADEAAPSAPQVRREGPSRDAPDAPPPLACGTLVKSDLPIVMWTFDPAAALGALSKSVGADAAAETDEPAPPSRSQKAERMVLGTPPRPPAPRRSATMSPNPAPYRSSSSRASKSAPGGPHAPRALASPPFHLPAAAAAAPCCRDGPAFRLLLVPSEWGSDGASLYLEALGNGATDAAAAPPQGGGGATTSSAAPRLGKALVTRAQTRRAAAAAAALTPAVSSSSTASRTGGDVEVSFSLSTAHTLGHTVRMGLCHRFPGGGSVGAAGAASTWGVQDLWPSADDLAAAAQLRVALGSRGSGPNAEPSPAAVTSPAGTVTVRLDVAAWRAHPPSGSAAGALGRAPRPRAPLPRPPAPLSGHVLGHVAPVDGCAPLPVVLVSERPRIVVVDQYLAPARCADLRRLARPLLQRSRVSSGTETMSRTSRGCFFTASRRGSGALGHAPQSRTSVRSVHHNSPSC